MSRIDPEISEKRYLEEILPKTGWGLYYKFMVGMACACCFSQGIAFASVLFFITLFTCEYAITRDIMMALHTSFFVGRALGGLLINILCDIYGRKKYLMYSLMIVFLMTFAVAFAYNYYVIIISAFILASGLESHLTIVKIHLAEILPRNRRGFYLSVCDIFWTLGYICLALFAIFMRNSSVTEHRAVDMRLTTWRMIFAISGGLNLVLACATALLEESPRYFLRVKKIYLALLILKQFYAINKSSYGESFEVKENDLKNIIHDYDLSVDPEPEGHMHAFRTVIVLMGKSVKLLFKSPFRKSTLLLLLLKTPLLILGPLDVNILLAKQLDVNSTVHDGIDVIYLDYTENGGMCKSLEENKILYCIYFAMAANIFIGQAIVMWLMDHLGRKFSLFSSLLLTGIFFVILPYVENSTVKIILSSILMVSFSAAISTISVINIESYPTAIRATSFGVLNFLGIILSIFVIRNYYLFAEHFFMVFGALFLCVSFVSYFIEDLKGKPMIE